MAHTDHPFKENYRPDWLISDLGERCELDFYVRRLSLAIEVQGEQHYKFIPYFHRTYEGFLAQQRRDQFKSIVCHAEGVRLFLVHTSNDILPISDYIMGFRQERDEPEEDPALERVKILSPRFYNRWQRHTKAIEKLAIKREQATDAVLRSALSSHIARREQSLLQLITAHQDTVIKSHLEPPKSPTETDFSRHEAVLLYEEVTGYSPNRAQQRDIGITVTDCALFRKVLECYVSDGRPVSRVQWPLYWYMRVPLSAQTKAA